LLYILISKAKVGLKAQADLYVSTDLLYISGISEIFIVLTLAESNLQLGF